jgi:hypothetical protein
LLQSLRSPSCTPAGLLARLFAFVIGCGALAACGGGGGGDDGDADAGRSSDVGNVDVSAPVADFAVTPIPGAPMWIEFDSNQAWWIGDATFDWTIGDSPPVTASGPRVAHGFSREGTFEVALTVTDELGRQATKTKWLRVTPSIVTLVSDTRRPMPNLVGMTQTEATATLNAIGLPLSGVTPVVSNTHSPGTVVSQWPAVDSNLNDPNITGARISVASWIGFGDVYVWQNSYERRLSERPLVPDAVRLVVRDVRSVYEIASVVARIGGTDTTLSYATRVPCSGSVRISCPGYFGDVSFAAQGVGEVAFEIRARDVVGNEIVGAYTVIHDNPPQLFVGQPANDSVVFGTLPVDVHCGDDSSCTVEIRVNGTTVASAPGHVGGPITLSTPVNTTVQIGMIARDERQSVSHSRTVYHEDPARLSVVDVVPGEIIDARGTRVLSYIEIATGDRLLIRDTATGSDEEIPIVGRSIQPTRAFLLSNGAIFESSSVTGCSCQSVSLWRLGSLTTLGSVTSGTLSVSGEFAIFNEGNTLRRLDAQSGAVDVVTTTGERLGNSVTADGTVVFWGDGPAHQLYRYRAGLVTALTNAPTLSHAWPLTDGDNTVFRRSLPNQTVHDIMLLEDTTATTVVSGLTTALGYRIANGWVAFENLGAQLQRQVFVRSPSGIIQQRTIFGTSSQIEWLRGNGELTVINQTRRYFSDGVNLPISQAIGESYLLADRWHVAIKGTLLAVNTTN